MNWDSLGAIGVNANEIHKWNHLPRRKRGKLVAALQDTHLLQSAKHHGKHHAGSKDTHYCVITDFVNPVLDKLRFWRTVETLIVTLLGVEKREDISLLERFRGKREQIEAFRCSTRL